jgi:hypothetical protein
VAIVTRLSGAYLGTDRKALLVRRDRPGLDRLAAELDATLVDPQDELEGQHLTLPALKLR